MQLCATYCHIEQVQYLFCGVSTAEQNTEVAIHTSGCPRIVRSFCLVKSMAAGPPGCHRPSFNVAALSGYEQRHVRPFKDDQNRLLW